jgi:hypothetical protein
MFLLLAVALPRLFWDGAVDTAPALRDAGITQIVVPAERVDSWKNVAGVSATTADPKSAVKLLPPGVKNGANQASASRDPWIDSNGWRFLRQPQGKFYYDVTEGQSALATAEAYCFGADAIVRSNAAGLKPLGQMLDFLTKLSRDEMPPVADIGFIDDGSDVAGEVMNLMVRGNLLFRIVTTPDRRLKLNVKLGSKEYPLEDAKNPRMAANQIRTNLTDDKRSVRVYGTSVVVARLTESGGKARLHLLNYAGATRKVNGVRVRVLGRYPNHKVAADDTPGAELQDFTVDSNATEFTLPELKTYAVIDLSR